VAYGKTIPGAQAQRIPCCNEDARRVLLKALEKINDEILILEGEKGGLPILLVGGSYTPS
jgi:hypothetical protein